MKLPSGKTIPGSEFNTLNPYYWSLRYLAKRLLWDLFPLSWVYRSKLKKIRNKYHGQKAVILCNGPSLIDVDFQQLKGVYTFGLNKVNLLFDKTDFRPSCIVAVNPFVLLQNKQFYENTDIPLFLDQKAISIPVSYRSNRILLSSSNIPFFARDCSMSIFQGYTVTYVAMQLAFHMGFTKVALVGCDHSFYGSSRPNEVLKSDARDLSHFSKDYFSHGQLWQYPDLKKSEAYYSLAKQVYEANGRKIYNASTRTELDVFPLIKLSDFLNE